MRSPGKEFILPPRKWIYSKLIRRESGTKDQLRHSRPPPRTRSLLRTAGNVRILLLLLLLLYRARARQRNILLFPLVALEPAEPAFLLRVNVLDGLHLQLLEHV